MNNLLIYDDPVCQYKEPSPKEREEIIKKFNQFLENIKNNTNAQYAHITIDDPENKILGNFLNETR